MEALLNPVDTIPSLFVYREYQKYTCHDYDRLTEVLVDSLFESKKDHQLMINWHYTRTHPLILEARLKGKVDRFDFWMRYFDLVLLPALQKVMDLPEATLLLAMPPQAKTGLRVHVVGVEVSHDDYVHLCKLLQEPCAYREGDLSVHLECPSNFPLPSSHRPHETGDLYRPVRLVRARFGWYQKRGVWRNRRLENIAWQEGDDSFFGQMVNHPSRWKAMARAMMPVPRPDATHLHFPTQIRTPWIPKQTALFRSHLNDLHYTIVKENVLVEGESFCYEFLKNHSTHIDLITPHASVLRVWYDRFRQVGSQADLFQKLDAQLRRTCPHLKHEQSPLAAVLQKYELPVYFALCNLFGQTDLQNTIPFLSKDLPVLPPAETRALTFDTIQYCAYRTGKSSMVDHILTGLDWIMASVRTLPELTEQVRWIQQRDCPVVREGTFTYAWDAHGEKWDMLEDPIRNIRDMLSWTVELLMTQFEISPKLLTDMMEEEHLQTVALQVWSDSEQVQGNHKVESMEMYGANVPEYYFLKNAV